MKSLSWYVFCAVRGLARAVFRKPRFEGLENLPEGPCVIVGNHAHMYGPVYAELYIPGDRAIWCNAEMMRLKEVPDYAFRDFWSKKPAGCRWFYRLLSYAIAPLSVCIFNNAHCIGVYHDSRVMRTLRASLAKLREGAKVVIYPEHEVFRNGVVWEFQEGFVQLARLYAHQAGEALRFVPMYVAPELRTVCFGKPVLLDAAAPNAEAFERVRVELMDAVTDLARSLPRHRMVPYPNLPRSRYLYNIPDAGSASHEAQTK